MAVRAERWRVAALWAALMMTASRTATAQAAMPPLDEVVREARAQAPALAVARGQVGVARAGIVGARASSFLNPSFEVRYEHGFAPGASTVDGALSLPFEVAGQRGARITEASARVRWQEAELGGAEARVLGEAVATYGEVLTFAARLGELSKAEEDARQEADWFTRRLRAGDATLTDQTLSEAELSRWAQQRAEASIALVEAGTRLAQLTGRAEPLLPGEGALTVDAPRLRGAWSDAATAAIAATNPDVRARTLEARHWDAARARWEAERTPPVSLILAAGRGDLGEARVGGGVGWTLPVARRNEGEIARAAAEASRASIERAATARVVAARLQGVHAMYRGARDALLALDEAGIPAARRHVDAAVASQRAGKIELVQVLIAKRDLAVAVTRRLDLVATAWRAYGELVALKGDLP